MVTKDYLDVKHADLKGDLVLLMRKEDTKVRALVELLEKKKIISAADAKGIFAMEWESDPGERKPSKKAAELITELGYDPKEWEFRCNNQRETDGEHNLWYYQDNFFLVDGGRRGLLGGYRRHGGASNVGYRWRGGAYENWAVRLVLSRKLGLSFTI